MRPQPIKQTFLMRLPKPDNRDEYQAVEVEVNIDLEAIVTQMAYQAAVRSKRGRSTALRGKIRVTSRTA